MWYNVRVNEEASLSIAKPRNVSLVDTISAGYRTLNRRPLVLAIPAALSAYLWLGAPIGLGSLAEELRLALVDAAGAIGAEQAAREELVRGLLASDLRVALAWLNFVPVLAPRGDAGAAAAIGLRGPLELIAAVVLVNLLALLVSSLFLTTLGEALQGERPQIWQRLRRSGRVARDICLALLALTGVGLILALPFLAISVIVIAIMPGATLLVLLGWYIALFWAYVYTGFAPEAITVGRAGPLRALYKSVHVVRRDLGGTLGLLLLSFVIASGLGVVWRQLAVSPPGLALAIIGSAYVGSGLAAARLQFFRDRDRGAP
jgi:hypothetical protein